MIGDERCGCICRAYSLDCDFVGVLLALPHVVLSSFHDLDRYELEKVFFVRRVRVLGDLREFVPTLQLLVLMKKTY